jgi:hypothetical protein
MSRMEASRSATAIEPCECALDRSAEAIAVYNDLLARFGTATELPLRELVAKAESRMRDLRLYRR